MTERTGGSVQPFSQRAAAAPAPPAATRLTAAPVAAANVLATSAASVTEEQLPQPSRRLAERHLRVLRRLADTLGGRVSTRTLVRDVGGPVLSARAVVSRVCRELHEMGLVALFEKDRRPVSVG